MKPRLGDHVTALTSKVEELLHEASGLTGQTGLEARLRLVLGAAEAVWWATEELRLPRKPGQTETSTTTVGGPGESPPPPPGFAHRAMPAEDQGSTRFQKLLGTRDELIRLLAAAGTMEHPDVVVAAFRSLHHLQSALDRLVLAEDAAEEEAKPPS